MKKSILALSILIIVGMQSVQIETNTNQTLTVRDQQYLLNLARQTACWYLKGKYVPKPDEEQLSDNVRKKLGCFVTFEHRKNGLRGCIGIFERRQSLYENVITRAIAATQDSRFRLNPVTYEELKDIKIEISVLTEPVDLPFDSPTDLLSKLNPSVDGVILYTIYGNSTYLPQVWEHFPQKEDFLSHLCRKHGAPMDAWKKDYTNVRVQTFQALVFGEESYGRKVVGPKGAVVGNKGAMLLGTAKPLKEGLDYGGGSVSKGTELAPGAIVTWDSDIIEPK